MAKFDLKIAMNLLPVASDDEVSIKQLIDSIEYYKLELDSESQKKLIYFVLKNRLSQNSKLKLELNYESIDSFIRAMKCNLLPKKSAPAIQTKLNNFKQNHLSIEEYGRQITNMFVDLTISQSDGIESDFKVLKPRNEKLAIKIFADGLRNRRLGTIVTARNYSSLNDAVQAALDEDSSSPNSGDILSMRHNNYQNYNYRGRRNSNTEHYRGWHRRGAQYQVQSPPSRGHSAGRGWRPNYGNFRRGSRPPANRDCLHLQLYRDPKDRYKKGQTKASLSLQHFLGFESGFNLDKESNTIAIICQDVTVVLAFETRERLIAWGVKVGGQLGSSKGYLVMIGSGGSKKLPPGPARMHIQQRRFALTSGVPPRLLGLWELAHLRRYGVVEGRFCFEGGSQCGKGEGLHMLLTDQAQEIADALDQTAQGNHKQRTGAQRSEIKHETNSRPNTRLSDFNIEDQNLQDTASALYEQNYFGEDYGRISPFWPSAERHGFDAAEYKPDPAINENPPWCNADHVTLERCNNCLRKLGCMARSSTVAINNERHFNPAWTMEAVPESSSNNLSNVEFSTPNPVRKFEEPCMQCNARPPQRPPKPIQYDKRKPILPVERCNFALKDHYNPNSNPKVGPYENYDVPKTTHSEVDNSEYYDTPKRINKSLVDDLFQVTKTSSPDSLVLKKKCGCILKFGSKKKTIIVESDENLQPVDCPCQKVTNWASTLISLPYCKRSSSNENLNINVSSDTKTDENPIYATVDISQKTNRQGAVVEKNKIQEDPNAKFNNYQNLEMKDEQQSENPYSNYENLEFALSLEYYENAKDLLKKAGVTQSELDALSANIDLAAVGLPTKQKSCLKFGSCKASTGKETQNKCDEYLLMEPTNNVKRNLVRAMGINPGYTPMSPNPIWSQTLRHPVSRVHKSDMEKSLSIPTLNGSICHDYDGSPNDNKEIIQKRSNSVDSAQLLEDAKEFDSSNSSRATTSSMETLRYLASDNRLSLPGYNDRGSHNCCEPSLPENEATKRNPEKGIPHLRNKHIDNATIKKSCSVPCKNGNRDSSSSNDSGVSSCSLKQVGGDFQDFEMPLTSRQSRYQYMIHKRIPENDSGSILCSLPRKSKSSDPLRDQPLQVHKISIPAKSSSAEAEVPVLSIKQFKGVLDTHSTSSGTSDMSDYIETLSLTSSHSSSETPSGSRPTHQPTSTLRPRSGKEYQNLDPKITSKYKNGKDSTNYINQY